MTDAELFSRLYALLGDRSAMPDGDVWEHGPLQRLVADVLPIVRRYAADSTCNCADDERPPQPMSSNAWARRAALEAAEAAVRAAKEKREAEYGGGAR